MISPSRVGRLSTLWGKHFDRLISRMAGLWSTWPAGGVWLHPSNCPPRAGRLAWLEGFTQPARPIPAAHHLVTLEEEPLIVRTPQRSRSFGVALLLFSALTGSMRGYGPSLLGSRSYLGAAIF